MVLKWLKRGHLLAPDAPSLAQHPSSSGGLCPKVPRTRAPCITGTQAGSLVLAHVSCHQAQAAGVVSLSLCPPKVWLVGGCLSGEATTLPHAPCAWPGALGWNMGIVSRFTDTVVGPVSLGGRWSSLLPEPRGHQGGAETQAGHGTEAGHVSAPSLAWALLRGAASSAGPE